MSDQPVEIVDYDPSWPDRFAEQKPAVEAVLSPWLAGPVEHVGSTSVPGLQAKPVIDMLALVSSLAAARSEAVTALTDDGWVYWPEDPAGDYRLWFLRPAPDARTHHLHVLERDDLHARALLAFRDRLRADPALRREYAELKLRLAERHTENRNAYTNAKGDFVMRVLAAAGFETPTRESLPE